MKKIKIIVKAHAGSGAMTVVRVIRHALREHGAQVFLDQTAQEAEAHLFSLSTTSCIGTQATIKLKTKQLPRVKREPTLEPVVEGEMQTMVVTAKERLMIESHRGAELTGYPIHHRDGKYYFWCWGKQPDHPAMHVSPLIAAQMFLMRYEPRLPATQASGFQTPVLKNIVEAA
jgi:hypothetical protein